MFSKSTLLALLPFFLQVNAQASGSGKTTRYWDCCKPSCSWSDKITLGSGSHPVTTCDKKDAPLSSFNEPSGCTNGGAFMCSNQSPWAVSDDLAYGFAATTIKGGTESSWCCACYELTFTSEAVKGKKMIVQATNTGSDLADNQFDISIPGGGFGLFNGCAEQWGVPSSDWGAQYGGVGSRTACDKLPAALKAGCQFRFDWFGGSNNPTVEFKQVACPAAITAKSGCVRAKDTIDETPTGPASGGKDTSTKASTTMATSAVPSTASSKSTSEVAPPAASTESSKSSSVVAPPAASSSAPAKEGISGVTELVAKYGQCGGKGWTKGTTCAAGSTCVAAGEYYSQCL
ncbi:RlpA-like double-psi beta-barrel-protein domain-containing protein-containing protein [Tricladium varicosporioides]|nr:RlpA-like double-psi beta-barrel-protein domain-containing protein-containing protein [Hymenoscyphus varicosporioides]